MNNINTHVVATTLAVTQMLSLLTIYIVFTITSMNHGIFIMGAADVTVATSVKLAKLITGRAEDTMSLECDPFAKCE